MAKQIGLIEATEDNMSDIETIENTESVDTEVSTQDKVENTESPSTGLRAAFESAREKLSNKNDDSGVRPTQTNTEHKSTETKSIDVSGTQPVSTLTAPHHWTSERKTVFSRLDKDAQEAWLSHDKDWERGLSDKITKYKPAIDVYDAVNASIDKDLRNEMNRRNINEGQVVSALIAMGRELDANPMAFIAKTMHRHKIDPRVFLQAGGQQENGTNVQSLLPVIQPLLSKVQELEKNQHEWQKQREQEHSKRTEATIESFKVEKDATGALKYPYIDRVVEVMADLVENNPRYSGMEAHDVLEHAYNAAIVYDPSIRAEIIAVEASKHSQTMQNKIQMAKINNAKTVKPATSSSGTLSGKRGLRGAYDDAKSKLGH